jgi:tetratricopeptide (TPR) repeat protein
MGDGAWDDALRSADRFIAECEAGSPHRGEQNVRMMRARIYGARDDVEAAVAECEKALALPRDSHDPHWFLDATTEIMEVYTQAGLIDDARALADEILSFDPAVAQSAQFSLAWVADEIGLNKQQLESLLDYVPHHTVWRRVGELLVAGNFEEVAEMAAEFGIKEFEANARVRAAEAQLAADRAEEAGRQLRQALVFYRSVGATRGIRKVDQLLAQTHKAPRPTEPRSQARN